MTSHNATEVKSDGWVITFSKHVTKGDNIIKKSGRHVIYKVVPAFRSRILKLNT